MKRAGLALLLAGSLGLLAEERVFSQVACDSSCRERKVWLAANGGVDGELEKGDCELCKTVAGLCVVKIDDMNTDAKCVETATFGASVRVPRPKHSVRS